MTHLLTFSIGDPGSAGVATPISNLPPGVGSLLNSTNPLNSLIHLTFNLLLFATALLSFIFIMWSGYKMLVSQGDKKEIEGVKSMFFNAIIGLVVVFLSFLFINVIGSFFHVNILNTSF